MGHEEVITNNIIYVLSENIRKLSIISEKTIELANNIIRKVSSVDVTNSVESFSLKPKMNRNSNMRGWLEFFFMSRNFF